MSGTSSAKSVAIIGAGASGTYGRYVALGTNYS